jgi:DNA-binding NarL/FixJ family response regulator
MAVEQDRLLTYQTLHALDTAARLLWRLHCDAVARGDTTAIAQIEEQIAALEGQIAHLEMQLTAHHLVPQMRPRRGRTPVSSPRELPRQQRAILALLAEGKHDKEIAAELSLALQTVKNHCAVLYKRLPIAGVGSPRSAAARWYLRHQHDE